MVPSSWFKCPELPNSSAAEIPFYFSDSRDKFMYGFTDAYFRKNDVNDKDSILSCQRLLSLLKKCFLPKLEYKTDIKDQKSYRMTKTCLSWIERGIVPTALRRKAKQLMWLIF